MAAALGVDNNSPNGRFPTVLLHYALLDGMLAEDDNHPGRIFLPAQENGLIHQDHHPSRPSTSQQIEGNGPETNLKAKKSLVIYQDIR